jgi:hypothetical protein
MSRLLGTVLERQTPVNSDHNEDSKDYAFALEYLAKHPNASIEEVALAHQRQLKCRGAVNEITPDQILPVRPVEVLSLTAGRLEIEGTKVVALTIRRSPANSPRSETLAVSKEQAERMRDDLNNILSADNITWR